jgi:hypothetical protein
VPAKTCGVTRGFGIFNIAEKINRVKSNGVDMVPCATCNDDSCVKFCACGCVSSPHYKLLMHGEKTWFAFAQTCAHVSRDGAQSPGYTHYKQNSE